MILKRNNATENAQRTKQLLNTLEERHRSCATWAHKKYKHQTTRRCKESQKRTIKLLLVQSASVSAQPPIPNDTFKRQAFSFLVDDRLLNHGDGFKFSLSFFLRICFDSVTFLLVFCLQFQLFRIYVLIHTHTHTHSAPFSLLLSSFACYQCYSESMLR